MERPRTVPLPPTAGGLIAADSLGTIWTVCLEDGHRVLLGFDLAGEPVHREQLATAHGVGLRVVDEAVWVSTDRSIARIGTDDALPIDDLLEPDEQVTAFLVAGDDMIISTRVAPPAQPRARVMRVTKTSITWSTRIPITSVDFEGVVVARAETGFRSEQMPAWEPGSWDSWLVRSEPLLVSGNRVLAGFADHRSGLGRRYWLDATNGQIVSVGSPSPIGVAAAVDDEVFLLGDQGYGAFESHLYDGDGHELDRWESHAYVVVTAAGHVRGVEVENVQPSRMSVVAFDRDGSVRYGDRLSGYSTGYPVLTTEDRMLFWRSGQLLAVDSDLRKRRLWRSRRDRGDDAFASRLVLANNHLVFTVGSSAADSHKLLIFEDAGTLAPSAWPCEGANPGNNPSLRIT